MNKDTKAFIAEYKQKKYLKELYNQNTLEFDFYFKYSGKIEYHNTYTKNFQLTPPEKLGCNGNAYNPLYFNDMSKYQLNHKPNVGYTKYLKTNNYKNIRPNEKNKTDSSRVSKKTLKYLGIKTKNCLLSDTIS